ncbi:MAG: GspH/FimT family pseudopilin [Gemmatimonadetes bacterium]|nr:GspH/FimT family pseudopilin [Gemmatimonadota bacterium]MBI3569297.1 GspH/FimT family pseudopilin [Gemmatimonadota bacterium]
MRPCRSRRAGATIIELSLVLTVAGILTTMTVPRVRTAADRLAMRGAVQDVRLALAIARDQAVRRGDYVAFVADVTVQRVRVDANGDVLFERDLGARRGVTLTATRDSITYAPTGLGYGAANTTIVLRRGARADTIVVSRLGRVR